MAVKFDKLFTFVPESKTETFKNLHYLKGSSDKYYNKICFLAGTGEIITRGMLFALNRDKELNALKLLVGNSLVNTGAQELNASTVIDFIQKVYEITISNAESIGDENSGLSKRLNDLIARVGENDVSGLSKRIADNESAITLLNKTDGSVGSIKRTVDDAIAEVISSAPEAFDTLKEIADWIGTGEVLNTTADQMYSDINDLKDKFQSLESGGGTISSKIEEKVNSLDSSLTLGSANSVQPETVTKDTTIDVLSSITISESDGKLDEEAENKSNKIILQADAAGAAADAYSTLLGKNTDNKDNNTIYGVKAYVDYTLDQIEVWEEYNGENN